MAETHHLTVWSCYVCPYAWRGAEWLGRVQEKLGERVQVTWKAFLLEQVNSRRELGWKAWEDARFTSRDIPPHEAAKSVLAVHGPAAFARFHLAVFRAYHVDKRDIANPLELLAIAREVDLDTTVLAEDLRTRTYKAAVGADHTEASDPYAIFGVPTILYHGGDELAFVKLAAGAWEGADDLELFDDLARLATRPYVLELKKPASATLAAASAARNR
jgi:predicted DsbA family dithiol-disulfide isomerase